MNLGVFGVLVLAPVVWFVIAVWDPVPFLRGVPAVSVFQVGLATGDLLEWDNCG